VVQFDVLGMLGLIILTGIVVNNAILIIHQMLNNEEAGMEPVAALRESARTRLRPIFMSVLTSVFGMLPLVVIPGSGSELYRGLGIIVVGGLLVSTIFTLFVVPTIMSLIQERYESINLRKYGTKTRPRREQAGD
jgi:HAE1 family hydrophobic/amphiphilic exporter-1